MRIILLLILTPLLTACRAGDDDPVAPEHAPLLLQTYAVPAHAAREIQNTLSYLLSGSGESAVIGRATVLGTDRIAVAAPARMQAGIERLIELGAESAGRETERIRFRYWLVEATPAEQARLGPGLDPIREALDSVSANLGKLRFTRLDFAESVLLSGASSRVTGRALQGSVNAVARDQRIAADLELFVVRGSASASTDIELSDGETIVLALVGGDRPEDDADGPGSFLAFVVEASLF